MGIYLIFQEKPFPLRTVVTLKIQRRKSATRAFMVMRVWSGIISASKRNTVRRYSFSPPVQEHIVFWPVTNYIVPLKGEDDVCRITGRLQQPLATAITQVTRIRAVHGGPRKRQVARAADVYGCLSTAIPLQQGVVRSW